MSAVAALVLGATPAVAQQPSQRRPELVLQSGFVDSVGALACSPDGLLVAGSSGNTAKLWEISSGRELRTFAGHGGTVSSVAFSPDGRLLVTGSWDRTAAIWDAATGRRVSVLSGHADLVAAAVFSPDGTSVLTASHDRTMKLWNVASGRQVRSFIGHRGRVFSAAFSSDGRYVLSGGADELKIWDAASGALMNDYAGRARVSNVDAVGFSRDGRVIVSAGWGVRLWDSQSGRQALVIQAPSDELGNTPMASAFALSPDGRFLASRWMDEKLRIWDFAEKREVKTIDREARVGDVVFTPDGRLLISMSPGSLRTWKVGSWEETETLAAKLDPVETATFGPDGRWLLTAGGEGGVVEPKDNRIKLWETATGTLVQVIAGHTDTVGRVVAGPTGDWFASRSRDRTVRVWALPGGGLVRQFRVSSDYYDFAITRDGRYMASQAYGGPSGDTGVKIWEAATGAEVKWFPGSVKALEFSRDGRTLASTGKVWDVQTGQEKLDLGRDVEAVALGPDGRLAARSVSLYGQLGVIDLTTGTTLRTLAGHTGAIRSLAFSSDGKRLASASLDQTIRLWDVDTGRALATFAGHTNWVQQVNFSPDEKMLVSAGKDGTVRLWEASTGELLATLLSFSGGNRWVITTPDGLFDGSPDAWDRILWRFAGNDVAPVELFFSEFYYPGLLADLVAGRRPKAPRDIAGLDRRQPVVTLSLADPAAVPMSARTVRLTVTVSESPAAAGRPQGSGAHDVRVFRNGSLVKAWRGNVLQGGTGSVTLETQVPIVAGANRFTAYAFNRDNVKSRDASLSVTGDASLARRGTVWVLAVGVNRYANPDYNLTYAAADSTAFADQLQRQLTQLGAVGRVTVVSLLDERATKGNILKALSILAGKETTAAAATGTKIGTAKPPAPDPFETLRLAQPEDAVFIYFAGHGTARGPRFYLLPHDLGYDGPREDLDRAGLEAILAHGISDEELQRALEAVDAGRMLLVIDACNSGQALEVAELGHGLLTYALVEEGLKTARADVAPRDGRVVMREWLDYATVRVPQMQMTAMETARKAGREVVFVAGENRVQDLRQRSVQRPRVFYRREPEVEPLVVAQPQAKPQAAGEAATGRSRR